MTTPTRLFSRILSLAIQGKLVSNHADDSVDDLLKEIAANNSARKKSKSEPISDDQIPFAIPDNWKWVRLGEIFDMKAGKAISASELRAEPDEEHQYPCYGGNGIRGYIGKYSNEGKYCIVGRQGALCGNVKLAEGQFYATEHAVVVYHSNSINTDWAYYFLGIANLNQYATSTAQPGLSVNTILQTLLPLPPLSVQSRIVSKLNEIKALVDECEDIENGLENDCELLRKKVLDLALRGRLTTQLPSDGDAQSLIDQIEAEKAKSSAKNKKYIPPQPVNPDDAPFQIPNNWKWVRLGEIGDWGAGATPSKSNPQYYDGDILWLTTGELNNGIVNDTKIKITQKALDECSLKINKIGSVLIAMYGATIGKLAIAGKEMTTNQACCGCLPILVYNKYLFYFLMANKESFIKMGSGGAQPNISKDKIVNTPFPLPPLAEQHRIVAALENIFAKIDDLRA